MEIIKEILSSNESVLRVSGRVDAVTAPDFEKALLCALEETNAGCILNLANTDYMSSAGLRVLVLGMKTAKSKGPVYIISGLQNSVREVLETVGFMPLLTVCPDESAAVKMIRKKADKS